MNNTNLVFEDLNFHDSFIDSLAMNEEGILKIKIHYYNWEGNEFTADTWKTKNLTIEVEHCIHLKFSSPGLSMSDQEIQHHESLSKHSEIIDQIKIFEENRKCKFENTIAIRFLTHSYGKSIFKETQGFLEIGGLNATLSWSETETTGPPNHIPAST